MPPLIERIKAYREELDKWEKAGRPYRSKSEIEFIYKECCEKCEFLTSQMGMNVCDVCGCFINKSLTMNKIALATTHCPIDKWLAKETKENNEIKQEKNIIMDSTEKNNPPIIGGSKCCKN